MVLIVFGFVYLGMILGRIPGLALDRTGVALLGVIVLLATGRATTESAWSAVDVGTMALLLGLMIVSAQFRLGGCYARIARALAEADVSPSMLLALLIGITGLLAAVLCNDIVCLAMAPVLVEGCERRKLNPVPFLLALACASNVGSAATLIGNPQNILIGQRLQLPFAGYVLMALVPSILGLAAIWWVIRHLARGQWHKDMPPTPAEAPPFNVWQTGKGVTVLAALMAVFLLTTWPRELCALAAGGLLMTSRRLASRRILALIDWQLLVLFVGLFVVNDVLASSGTLGELFAILQSGGLDLGRPVPLFLTTAVLSNLVSNVPAVMLLLPVASHPLAGAILALSSTLAGNLLVVGSIANIIVIDQAARMGVTITWRDHARVGIPVTLLTLAIAGAWLVAWSLV